MPWYHHAPALNTKSVAPNARAPEDLYLVATLLGGGADACLLAARPAAASREEAALGEAAARGQGPRRLQSKAVSANGLQAVFNQPLYVRTASPQLAVLHLAVHAAAHAVRGGVTGDAVGPAVAYATLPLGAFRFGCRVFQLCAPDCGGPIAFAALLCRTERCAERSPPPSSRRAAAAAAAAAADRLPDRLLDAAAARRRAAKPDASARTTSDNGS